MSRRLPNVCGSLDETSCGLSFFSPPRRRFRYFVRTPCGPHRLRFEFGSASRPCFASLGPHLRGSVGPVNRGEEIRSSNVWTNAFSSFFIGWGPSLGRLLSPEPLARQTVSGSGRGVLLSPLINSVLKRRKFIAWSAAREIASRFVYLVRNATTFSSSGFCPPTRNFSS
jgi:hypothetical protein